MNIKVFFTDIAYAFGVIILVGAAAGLFIGTAFSIGSLLIWGFKTLTGIVI